jgi:spore maturation protein CgeB
MKIVLFCHAFTSCWNNGHAHFLRGIVREILALGHSAVVCEAKAGWSRNNALADGGAEILSDAERLVPGAELHQLGERHHEAALEALLDGADIVLVHEWNDPSLVAAVGRRRVRSDFLLFFLESHHRAVTAPATITSLELEPYDGVLAFGESLRQVYERRGWGRRAYTWHEAADTALFRPISGALQKCDLVWIGNWGDEERSRELQEFLIEPVRRLRLEACVHGVRYPQHALDLLARSDIRYLGWLPNHKAPEAFAGARATVHIPRQPYNGVLGGIPTIRVFEALACGIPLACSPWSDEEQLFPPDVYLQAATGADMTATLRNLLADAGMASELSRKGREAIERRHTCRHRVQELLSIASSIRGSRLRDAAAAPISQMEAVQ